MLNDRQIREAMDDGDIRFSPSDYVWDHIQPASVDIRLGSTITRYERPFTGYIDPKVNVSGLATTTFLASDQHYLLLPGEFVLAATMEEVALGATIMARIEGKSSLGRLGLIVHATAGFVDPGWPQATLTLEIANLNSLPIRLYPGMPIAQLAFERIEAPDKTYNGKYTYQRHAAASQYQKNWDGEGWV